METSVLWKYESSSCFYGNCLILIVPSLLDCVTLIRFTGLMNVVLITNNDRSNQPDHSTRLEVVTQSPGFNVTPYDASCWYKRCVVTEVCCHRGEKNQTFYGYKTETGKSDLERCRWWCWTWAVFHHCLVFHSVDFSDSKDQIAEQPHKSPSRNPEWYHKSAAGFIYKVWASCREQWWKNNPVGRNLLLTQSCDTAVGDGRSFFNLLYHKKTHFDS